MRYRRFRSHKKLHLRQPHSPQLPLPNIPLPAGIFFDAICLPAFNLPVKRVVILLFRLVILLPSNATGHGERFHLILSFLLRPLPLFFPVSLRLFFSIDGSIGQQLPPALLLELPSTADKSSSSSSSGFSSSSSSSFSRPPNAFVLVFDSVFQRVFFLKLSSFSLRAVRTFDVDAAFELESLSARQLLFLLSLLLLPLDGGGAIGDSRGGAFFLFSAVQQRDGSVDERQRCLLDEDGHSRSRKRERKLRGRFSDFLPVGRPSKTISLGRLCSRRRLCVFLPQFCFCLIYTLRYWMRRKHATRWNGNGW